MSRAARDLAAVTRARRTAAAALAGAFTHHAADEAVMAAAWVDGLRRGGLEWCWYVPPPSGTTVLSGAHDPARLAVASFRPPECWPDATPISRDAPVTVYTSPVSADGMIGDLGLTVYRGDDRAVRDHLTRVAELVHRLGELAEPGLAYAELYTRAQQGWRRAGLTNDITSGTDPAGTNIGHSIPFFGADRPALVPGEHGARVISAARQFVSATNRDVIGDTCAFTIEPRLGRDTLPVAWFHVVVAFVDGHKHVITEFDPVLALDGCDWFENPWAT